MGSLIRDKLQSPTPSNKARLEFLVCPKTTSFSSKCNKSLVVEKTILWIHEKKESQGRVILKVLRMNIGFQVPAERLDLRYEFEVIRASR